MNSCNPIRLVLGLVCSIFLWNPVVSEVTEVLWQPGGRRLSISGRCVDVVLLLSGLAPIDLHCHQMLHGYNLSPRLIVVLRGKERMARHTQRPGDALTCADGRLAALRESGTKQARRLPPHCLCVCCHRCWRPFLWCCFVAACGGGSSILSPLTSHLFALFDDQKNDPTTDDENNM